MKAQYMLEEQEVVEATNVAMNEPKAGNMVYNRQDRETYGAWTKNTLWYHIAEQHG